MRARSAVLFAALVLAGTAQAREQNRPIHVGDRAPPFGPLSVVNASEAGVSEMSYAPGHVWVLSFFAGWCPGCVNEMPALTRLAKLYSDRGVTVLSISVDESPEASTRLAALLRRDHVVHPVAVDPNQAVLHAYQGRNLSLPYLLVIDSEGVVRLLEEGFTPSTESKVRGVLDGLLKPHR